MTDNSWLLKLLAGVAAVTLAAICFGIAVRPSPEEALSRFYLQGSTPENAVPEEALTDPLILAGERVVPLVMREVSNKSMRRRSYAISFLGGYHAALPVLVGIVGDATESPAARAAALESVWRLDESKGRNLAAQFASERSLLGGRALALLSGRAPIARRTWHEALLNWL